MALIVRPFGALIVRPTGALLACLCLTLASAQGAPAGAPPDAAPSSARTNLAHLRFLTQEFPVEGEEHLGVWIYSEPSPTDPDAYVGREAAGEGVTDLDDVARAAVAYLWWYRLHGDEEALELARGLLDFTMAMQAEDGEFYNFVFADGQINRLGITSRKGAGFWAARALWALAEGLRVFRGTDPDYAARLREAFLRGLPPFEAKVAPGYGTFESRHGFSVPAWLVDDGADVSSNLLLGLAVFLQQETDDGAALLMRQLAHGLTAFQYGPAGTYPFLAHPSFARDPLEWHAWGSRQTQALAGGALAAARMAGAPLPAAGVSTRAGGPADDASAARAPSAADYLLSAEAEASHFFVHLLVGSGPIATMNPAVRAYPQIAYGMESLANGYFALADATGKSVYNVLGGLTASWLLGNNALRQPMYDPATGRVYDGLERGVINRNAGAESTITGLMALMQAEARPAAEAMLDLQWLEAGSDVVVEAETGSDFGEAPPTEVDQAASGQLAAVLTPGAGLRITATVPRAGRYRVYALHRQDPWEASVDVFVGSERIATVRTGGAAESRYRMTELGTVELAAGDLAFTLRHAGGRDARFDALVLRPETSWKLYGEPGERWLLLKSWASDDRSHTLPVAVPPEAAVMRYDALADSAGDGELGTATSVDIPAYGFALLRWASDEPLPEGAATQARQGPVTQVEAAFEQEGFVALDLGSMFNADAFSLPSRPQRGNFDNRSGVFGATYPAERAPAPSTAVELAGVPFLFPPTDEEANNVVLVGQRLAVPPGRYSALRLLGSSEQGNYQATVTLRYEDGSEELTLGLSDWCQAPRYGEAVAVLFEQRRGSSGATERIACRMLMQTLALDPTRTLTRIDMPDRETMHLFAITLEGTPEAAPEQP